MMRKSQKKKEKKTRFQVMEDLFHIPHLLSSGRTFFYREIFLFKLKMKKIANFQSLIFYEISKRSTKHNFVIVPFLLFCWTCSSLSFAYLKLIKREILEWLVPLKNIKKMYDSFHSLIAFIGNS